MWTIIKKTFVEFFQEKSFFHGAALSYYTVFSLVPLIYLAIMIFGAVVGETEVLNLISKLLKEQVGLQDVSGLMSFLKGININKSSWLMFGIGIVTLLLTSSALLSSLRMSINEFYDISIEIKDRKKMIEYQIGTKLVSMFLLPLLGAILLVLYFGLTFLLSLLQNLMGDMSAMEWLIWSGLANFSTILMNAFMFALVLKYVHDGKVDWKSVFYGGLFTAVLLFIGQLLIKYYLQHYFFGSKAGVAGTLYVLLAWMYYTSQIIFLGAKFTKIVAIHFDRPIHFAGRKITTKKIVNSVKFKKS